MIKSIYWHCSMLIKTVLLFCLTWIGHLESQSQTITATVTSGVCAATYTFTLNGTLNGRNQYTGSLSGFVATLSWSGSRWEISSTLTGVVFYNAENTTPDPPCYNVGTWVSAGTCAGGTFTNSTGNCTIPVELVAFSVKNTGKINQLTWATASELNNKGFYIQRSSDGQTWQPIDFVASKGTKGDYTFMDEAPLSITYYRLQQEDMDGQIKYSKTVSANAKTIKGALIVSTNPIKSDFIHIEGLDNSKSDISITNIYGQFFYQQTFTADRADIKVALPAGVYFVNVKTEKTILSQKIVRE